MSDQAPLWSYERFRGKQCEWFAEVDCIFYPGIPYQEQQNFWSWCEQHCQGQVFCYSSSADRELWGFTCENDITFWVLKWG